jgi:hypothetical protein
MMAKASQWTAEATPHPATTVVGADSRHEEPFPGRPVPPPPYEMATRRMGYRSLLD